MSNVIKKTIFVVCILVVIAGCLVSIQYSIRQGLFTLTSIPGWERFNSPNAEIWLPENFEGGDISQDIDTIIEILSTPGSGYEYIANMIEQNPSAFELCIYDSEISNSGLTTGALILKENIMPSMKLDYYADKIIKRASAEASFIEGKEVKLDRYDAIQLTIEIKVNHVTTKELIYLIKNENTLWMILYATSESEFKEWLPIFEQSANTFLVYP